MKAGSQALVGTYRHPEGNLSSLTGELNLQNGLTARLSDGAITFSNPAPGNMNTDGMSVRFLVRGGSADGQTLVFTR